MDSTAELLALPSGPAQVQWRRSARARRVSLRIDPRRGAVVVTLPLRAGRRAGMALLMDHADWVAERLAALPSAVAFADGAEVPLNGVPCRIRHAPDARGGAWLEDRTILVAGAPEFLPRRVADFLRSEARRRLAALVAAKTAQAALASKRVAVKDTRSRWGSCSPDGSLAFSWRLVMAPEAVIDYVVAHEVAHLVEMNHGPRFWRLVRDLVGDPTSQRAWLKRHRNRLFAYG